MNNTPNSIQPCCPYPPIEVREVESVAAVRNFKNAFVHANDINTTFFIDSSYRPTIIFQGPVFIDDYDYQTNPNSLRNQICYDFKNNLSIIYNSRGDYRLIKMEEENE